MHLTPTDQARAALAQRIAANPLYPSSPLAVTPWPFGELTAQQQHERALLEAAMRAGQLRRLPTVFGALA